MEIGEMLFDSCNTCSLATSEIGGLGWKFNGKVLDGFGLGDPDAVKFHPLKVPEQRSHSAIGAIPPGYIKLKNPDFIVSMPIFIEYAQKSGMLQNYHKYSCNIFSDRSPLWGSPYIQIFSKHELDQKNLDLANCNG